MSCRIIVFVRLFFCIQIIISTVGTNLANIEKGEKKIVGKLKKLIPTNKLQNLRLYVGGNMTYRVSKRVPSNIPLTKIHQAIRKKQFVSYMQKVQYVTLNMKNEKITTLLQPDDMNKLWEYFSAIFSEVIEQNGILLFQINNELAKVYNSNIDNSIRIMVFFNKMINIFKYRSMVEIPIALSEIFYFYSLTSPVTMKQGAVIDDGVPGYQKIDQWQVIDKVKFESKEIKDLELIKKINEDNILIGDNMNFFHNLIPILDESGKIHFVLLNKNKQTREPELLLWKKYNFEHLSQDIQEYNQGDKKSKANKEHKCKFEKIKDIYKIEEEKEAEKETTQTVNTSQTINKQNEPDKEQEKIELEKTIKYENLDLTLFSGKNTKSNYITFLYLLWNKKNDYTDIKDLENFKQILTERKSDQLNLNNINRSFFFLLGGHNMNGDQGYLPTSYILKHNTNIVNYDTSSQYDIPDYSDNNNLEQIKKALYSLPETSECSANQISVGIYALLINDYLCASAAFDYVLSSDVQNESSRKTNFNRNFYLDLFFGVRTIKNLYLCFAMSFMFFPQYCYNKIFDLALGLGIIVTAFPFTINLALLYDMYLNMWICKISLTFVKCVYNKEIKINEDEDESPLAIISYM